MFELSIKVVEIKGDEKENLLGPMQSDAAERERQEEEQKKEKKRKKRKTNKEEMVERKGEDVKR